MDKTRMEAFTDGVIAIIITIMVLDMKIPTGSDLGALRSVLPLFLAYALSFANVAIFWNNHHHMLQATEKINGNVLWANTALLFWISLSPFALRWMDDTHFASTPTAVYGVVLVMMATTYIFLARTIIACNGPQSKLARAIGKDSKSKISLMGYLAAVPLAFVSPWISIALYVFIAMIWFIPDPRIESSLSGQRTSE
jgi:uncharacterized membrane protein